MTDNFVLLLRIRNELRARGHRTTVEFPGCVVIHEKGEFLGYTAWWFGTANENWSGDLHDASDNILRSVQTNVPSTSEDAVQITGAILKALFSIPRS